MKVNKLSYHFIVYFNLCKLFLQVEINHAREIDEIFDAISYRKGASVIRMLQSYLGAECFQVSTWPLMTSLKNYIFKAKFDGMRTHRPQWTVHMGIIYYITIHSISELLLPVSRVFSQLWYYTLNRVGWIGCMMWLLRYFMLYSMSHRQMYFILWCESFYIK